MRFALFVVAALCGACEASGTPSGLSEPVTLVVTVDKSQFAPAATLDVRLWNAGQLAILEANARCTAVTDPQTGGTRFQCPEGIQYREVTPERFELAVATLGDRIELKSASIQVGERFRLRLSALYRDKCNTTAADRVLEARSARTIVGNLDWQATAKACLVGATL